MVEIKLIVGLGNPGAEYENTRHNAGLWLLDSLATHYGVTWKRDLKFKSSIAKVASSLSHRPLWLLKPDVFMNESGISVSRFCFFYKIQASQVMILHDELDLLPGVIKCKKGGGNAGHNGLKNVQMRLGSDSFWRIRIGIGHPRTIDTPIKKVSDFVLSEPSAKDENLITTSSKKCVSKIDEILAGKFKTIESNYEEDIK